MSYKTQLANITTFIFDVDGVFTNSQLILMPDGEMVRTMTARDGYAVQLAVKKGFNICIITGGRSEAVRKRFNGLGVKDVHLAISDKATLLNEYMKEKGLSPEEIVYVGDDIPDYEVMQLVGLPCCPVDAVPEIKSVSKYVSPYEGGKGCVRDIVEQTLKVHNKWMTQSATKTTSA